MLTINLRTRNAAFEDSDEIGRILRELAERIDDTGMAESLDKASGILRDSNGNNVGGWSFDPDAS